MWSAYGGKPILDKYVYGCYITDDKWALLRFLTVKRYLYKRAVHAIHYGSRANVD